jgi:hypothetical protein
MAKGSISLVIIIFIIMFSSTFALSIFYITYTLTSSVIKSNQQESENFGDTISSLFGIDGLSGHKVYMRNLGSIVLSNQTFRVYIDRIPVNYTMETDISPGQLGSIRVSGLSRFSFGDHTLRITGKGMYSETPIKMVKNTEGSVEYLEFNEGQGETYHDISGYGNDVYCSEPRCPSIVAGINGTALKFNPDDNDYLISAYWDGFPSGGETVMYSAWIYIQDYRSGVIIAGFPSADDTALMIDNGYLNFVIYDDQYHYYAHNQTLQKKTWYYVSGSYENSNVHLTVNNNTQHWYNVPFTPRGTHDSRIIIGAFSPSNSFLHGNIDDVRIFNEYYEPYENVSMFPR